MFNEAANMVDYSPALTGRLNVVRSTKRITFPRTRSFYRALSADVPAKEGLNAHAVLLDELHAQRTRDLWDTLRYAGASRRQPLLLSITTAGFDRHSICWEQHAYAEQVLSGVIQDSAFFAYIAAAEIDEDWTDPAVWRKANPSFGVTVSEDQFAEDCREAQESPAKEHSFRRYRLNQWVESETRWLSLEKWDACSAMIDDLDGKHCFAGLDLSSTTDLSAFVLVFPIEDRFVVLPFFWIPEEGMRRRDRRDRVPYTEWVRQGLIEATPGEVIDYDRIRADQRAWATICDQDDCPGPLERHAIGDPVGRRRIRGRRLRTRLQEHELADEAARAAPARRPTGTRGSSRAAVDGQQRLAGDRRGR